MPKFNPDYLCGLPACEENTRNMVAEYHAEIERMSKVIDSVRNALRLSPDMLFNV